MSASASPQTGPYWNHRRLTVRVEGPRGAYSADVDKPFARIGSHPRAELVLDDPAAPALLYYIHATDRSIYGLELAAVGGDKPVHPRKLAPGSTVSVGEYRVTVNERPDTQLIPLAATRSVAVARRRAERVTLSVAAGSHVAHRQLRSRLTVVGRGAQCTLRIPDRSISRAHCLLYWADADLWVVDLLSSNGTRLAGESIDCAILPPDRMLGLNRIQLFYQQSSPPSSVPVSNRSTDAARTDPPRANDGGDKQTANQPPASASGSPVFINSDSPVIFANAIRIQFPGGDAAFGPQFPLVAVPVDRAPPAEEATIAVDGSRPVSPAAAIESPPSAPLLPTVWARANITPGQQPGGPQRPLLAGPAQPEAPVAPEPIASIPVVAPIVPQRPAHVSKGLGPAIPTGEKQAPPRTDPVAAVAPLRPASTSAGDELFDRLYGRLVEREAVRVRRGRRRTLWMLAAAVVAAASIVFLFWRQLGDAF